MKVIPVEGRNHAPELQDALHAIGVGAVGAFGCAVVVGVIAPVEGVRGAHRADKDDISQPVKTSYGYHVIQVTGITPAKQSTLDEVKEEITSTLLNQKKYEVWNEWLTKTKTEIGVIYKEGMEPTTTTTAATTATTSGPSTTAGATTSSTASDLTTTTTATGSTTSTAKP